MAVAESPSFGVIVRQPPAASRSCRCAYSFSLRRIRITACRSFFCLSHNLSVCLFVHLSSCLTVSLSLSLARSLAHWHPIFPTTPFSFTSIPFLLTCRLLSILLLSDFIEPSAAFLYYDLCVSVAIWENSVLVHSVQNSSSGIMFLKIIRIFSFCRFLETEESCALFILFNHVSVVFCFFFVCLFQFFFCQC